MSNEASHLLVRIYAIANDTSRPIQERLDTLSEARAEIDVWIDALESEYNKDTCESTT